MVNYLKNLWNDILTRLKMIFTNTGKRIESTAETVVDKVEAIPALVVNEAVHLTQEAEQAVKGE